MARQTSNAHLTSKAATLHDAVESALSLTRAILDKLKSEWGEASCVLDDQNEMSGLARKVEFNVYHRKIRVASFSLSEHQELHYHASETFKHGKKIPPCCTISCDPGVGDLMIELNKKNPASISQVTIRPHNGEMFCLSKSALNTPLLSSGEVGKYSGAVMILIAQLESILKDPEISIR